MATHSSTLAWKIPWMEKPGRLQSMGSLRVGYDWVTSLSLFTFMHWRRKWQPTPAFLLENPRDRGAWWAAVYGVAQSWTRLKRLSGSSSRLVIAFLPRSKHLLISWLQSPFAVILEPKKIQSVTVSIIFPSICHKVMGPDAMILVFWMMSFKPAFSLSSFTFIKRLFSSSLLSDIRCHLNNWIYWYLCQQARFQLVLHLALHFAWCTWHIS